jgi:Fe-S-cluster containining protein
MSIEFIQQLPPQQKEKLYQELQSIYDELEQTLETIPRPCQACGACCQFSSAEHRLYGSGLELANLLDHHPHLDPAKEDRCPYQIEGKCTVRTNRLIGCRTYYRLHENKDRVLAEEAYEVALAKVKRLHLREGIPWEYRDIMSLFKKKS